MSGKCKRNISIKAWLPGPLFRGNSGKALSEAMVATVGKRTFSVNRTQNLLISAAAIIVIILITAACSVFYNLQRFGAMQGLKEKGTMTDVVLAEPDDSQISLLQTSDLVQKPLYISYKLGRLVGNAGQSGLSLSLYAEENWDLWSRPLFSDIEGKYPVEEHEVMMSTWLLKRLGIEPVIGSEITLSAVWEDTDAVQPEQFVLSGYYTDTSYIDTASRQKVLLSTEALARHAVRPESVGFSFTGGQFQKKLRKIREQLNIAEEQNLTVLGGQGFHLSPRDFAAAMGVILFFMLDGFLIIYNINTISVTKDIRFYGLLKTIGAAPAHLKRLLYYRMRRILLTVLPVGLLLGCLITQRIVPRILDGMLEGFSQARFHLMIPVVSALFSGVMIFASFSVTARTVIRISPIEALRYVPGSGTHKVRGRGGRRRNVSRKRSDAGGADGRLTEMAFQSASRNPHSGRTGGLPPVRNPKLCWMGFRNVFRQPQKACLVIGTFFLSSAAFLLCMTVLDGMSLDEFIEYNTAHDIALYNSMSRASFSPREEQSFTPELVERLRNIEGAEAFHMTKVVPVYEQYSDEVYGDWLTIKNEFEEANGMEPADTKLWTENPKAAFWSLLVGIDSDLIEEYNQSTEKPIDIEGFENGEFLLTTEMNGDGLRMGSVITFSVMDTDQQFELPVGGQFPLARDGMNSGAAPWLVVSNNVIDEYREDAVIYSIQLDGPSEYEENVLEQVIELTDGIPAISRTSKVELARSLEEAKSSLSKLSAFLTVVLFTVGILNFINTMSVSILDRQREFAAMEAVGASGRQVRDLITWEGIWYFVFTLALSVTAGTGADYLIFRVVREHLGFGRFCYPAVPAAVYMLLSFVLCMTIPAVIYQKVGIRSIVERLRED